MLFDVSSAKGSLNSKLNSIKFFTIYFTIKIFDYNYYVSFIISWISATGSGK